MKTMKLTDDQRAELAALMRDHLDESENAEDRGGYIADVLAPQIEAWLRDAQAAAWNEGFNAGEQDVFEHERLDDWDSECIRNPYVREWRARRKAEGRPVDTARSNARKRALTILGRRYPDELEDIIRQETM